MAIALVILLFTVVGWVAGTVSGTRWFLQTVPSLVGLDLSAQKIEGTISDHLILTQVRLNLPQQKLELDRIELRWKPLLLMAGTVGVQELTLNGVRIQDNSPPDTTPLTLAWPQASRTAKLFDLMILRLNVTHLNYRSGQEQPLQVASFTSSVNWQGGLLSMTELKSTSPSAIIQGSISAGFSQPSLASDLVIALTEPVGEMDRFTMRIQRSSDTGPEQFAGAIAITGSAGTRKLFELTGEAGMERTAINLRRLSLTRPGRRGLLNAEGSLAFFKRESVVSLLVKARDLDLAPELNLPTNLSGTLSFKGTLDSYGGELILANQGREWRETNVTAVYNGTREGLKVAPFTARILDGSLSGNMDLDWRSGFALQGAINGRNLNPARIDPAWKGVANFSADAKLAWSGEEHLTGSIHGALLESSLHGQALTGELQANFADDNLSLERLKLQGKGFDLQARGDLNQRINLVARVSDFSRLVPGSAGALQSVGWVRWHDSQLSGALTGTGSKLSYGGTRAAALNLSVRLDQGADYPMHVAATLRDVVYGSSRFSSAILSLDGTLARHSLNATLRSTDSEARLALSAGYQDSVWKGQLTQLAGRDINGPWRMQDPTSFSVSSGKISISPLVLTGGAAERLEASADFTLNPLGGQVQAKWSGLKLSRVNPYLKDGKITGNSQGSMRLGFLPDNRLALTMNASGSGTFSGQGQSVTVLRSQLTLDGNQQGLRGSLELSTASGGRLKGTFSSSSPMQLVMPEKGELTAEISGIDLLLIKPWLPHDTGLDGLISGRLKGVLLPGQRFELDGNALLSGGTLRLQRPDGEVKLTFNSASSTWNWRGETLAGSLSLVMADHGQARATFQLPIAAHIPVAVNSKGPLRATVSGRVQEKGLITALFPELVQESFGELDSDLVISGTWSEPNVGGTLKLAKAGAYLPTAGIHLKDVQLAARLEKNLIRISVFRANSGSGHLEGTALITLADWQVKSYQGTIGGENFLTVNFPELRVVSTPKLSFEGTPEKLNLAGELLLPELNIVSSPLRKGIAPSSDVILEGRVVPVEKASALVLDAQVKLLLGDKVTVKISGIDAQLGGAMNLSFTDLDSIVSTGEIKVVKGRYRTYGVNLDIIRGRLFFAGGPIERPALDFLALRTIGNIRAGVTVSGTLQKPVTKLYSEPAMPDVDVLAYIVLGHPLGSSGEQASLVNQAAGALLTSGQAGALQEQLKDRLGLSTLEIQGGVGGSSGTMGYKPLQVTPPGAIAADQQTGITETVLTVGKYLTPQLYMSYGKSVFTGSNLYKLRYDISKHWQIETQTGNDASGADLYYKLEFK